MCHILSISYEVEDSLKDYLGEILLTFPSIKGQRLHDVTWKLKNFCSLDANNFCPVEKINPKVTVYLVL